MSSSSDLQEEEQHHHHPTRENEIMEEIEDDLFKAAEIVRKEAHDAVKLAQNLKTFLKTVQEDANKVEAFVDKVNEIVDNKGGLNGILEEVYDHKSTTKDSTTFVKESNWMHHLWLAILFSSLLLLINWMILHFHLSEAQENSENSQGESQDINDQSRQGPIYFHIALLNIGPVAKILGILRNIWKKETNVISKVKDEVDIVAEYVKTSASAAEGIVEGIEKISSVAENDAKHFEDFLLEIQNRPKHDQIKAMKS